MPLAGYNSSVKVAGVSTGMIGEPTTELVADTVFQVTDATKRVLDPAVTVTVLVNGIPAPIGSFTVNYLFGTITKAVAPADVVTVSANFFPMAEVLEGKEFSVAMSRDLADSTVFKTSPHRTKHPLLKDASGSIGSLRALLDFLGAGATPPQLWQTLLDGLPVVLEIWPASSGDMWRGWVVFESQEVAASMDDLVNATISWQLAANGTSNESFKLQTP